MLYDEIISSAMAYADRTDASVSSKIGIFLSIVESRISRYIHTQDMVIITDIIIIANTFLYPLPADFLTLRGITIKDSLNPKNAYQLNYVNPGTMDDIVRIGNYSQSYTMIGNNVMIASLPNVDDTETSYVLEISYYKDIPPLNATDNENWLSILSPDAYIFGLMVEISSFVKDKEAAIMWDSRFKNSLDELGAQDDLHLYGGPPIITKIG